jgi:tetratricopeptide (TPR) repeat protein
MKRLLLLPALLLCLALPAVAQKKYVTTGVIEFNDKNFSQARQNFELALANTSLLTEPDIVKSHYYYYATLMELVQPNIKVDAKNPATGEPRTEDEMRKLVKEKLDAVFAKMPDVAEKGFQSFKYVYEKDTKGDFKKNLMQYYFVLLQLQAYQLDKHVAKPDVQREDLVQGLVYSRNLEFMSAMTGGAIQKITPKILNAKILLGMRTAADSTEAKKELKVFADNFDKALGGLDEDMKGKLEPALAPAVGFIAKVYSEMGDYEIALQIIARAQMFYPKNEEIVDAEMDVYLHPKLINESIPRFRKELADNPNDVKMIVRMARVTKRKSDASRNAAQVLVDSLKNNDNTLTRQQKYLLVEEVQKAIAPFETEVEESVTYYKKAIELEANSYIANYNLGAIYNNWAALYGDFYNVVPYSNSALLDKTMKRRDELLRDALKYMEEAYNVNQDADALDKCIIIAGTLNDQEKLTYFKSKQ